MVFSSPEFVLGFLPVVFALYLLVQRYLGRVRTIQLLVAASLIFYGWWHPRYILLIGGSIVFNWLVSRHLHRGHQRRGLVLAFGVVCNVLLLGYFKYTSFLIENANWIVGAQWDLAHIVLPLAISFFTFQQIAYLVDSYSGDTSRYRFQEYALFIVFFPQLIAGPIVHHTEMLTQFCKSDAFRFRLANLSIGLTAFSIGLFKKVVLADNLGAVADPVFATASDGSPLAFFDAWVGALAFFLQVYFDFSGYSDMALGLARMFGIRLPLNFNSPYKARNIIDFWQRWHITLTRFLVDYIYSPLTLIYMRKGVLAGDGRVRLFVRAVIVPVFVVFLVSGLWHGAGWTFVIWGMFHFVGMATVRSWQEAKLPLLPYPVAWFLTMSLVLTSLVFFRASSIPAAFAVLDSMFGGGNIHIPRSLQDVLPVLTHFTDLPRFRIVFTDGNLFFTDRLVVTSPRSALFYILSGGAICLLLPNCAELLARFNPVVDRRMPAWTAPVWIVGAMHRIVAWRPSVAWSATVAVMFAISLTFMLRTDATRQFIYFQF
ncbi:MAG: MBOAT family O-acyltransferase [Kiloniellales bacterium]